MRRMRRLALPVLLVGSLGVLAPGGAGAASGGGPAAHKPPKPKLVTVADFYYGPSTATIKKGGSVKWVWAPTNTESHDVHLKSGPKGLKQKASYSTTTTAVTNAEFKKTFETPGTYHFICTIHPTQMKMTVTVTK